MRFIFMPYILFFLILPSKANLEAVNRRTSDPWVLKRNENGIKVYTRKAKNSSLLEFKGITKVEASPTTLEGEIRNVKSYKKWMDDILESRVLKMVDKNHFYSYTLSEVPWPFSNRDIILLNTVINHDSVVWINLVSKPDFLPEKANIVRIKTGRGYWKFSQITKDKSLVEYRFFSNPEGSFPDWLVNKFIVDIPFNTLKNLKKKFRN